MIAQHKEKTTAQAWVDRTRNVLAFGLMAAFTGAIVIFTYQPIMPESKDILTYMVGQLSGMATMALGFYFTKGAGQDQLDATKSENTGKMADAVIAAATGVSPHTSTTAATAAATVATAATDKADEIIQDATESKP